MHVQKGLKREVTFKLSYILTSVAFERARLIDRKVRKPEEKIRSRISWQLYLIGDDQLRYTIADMAEDSPSVPNPSSHMLCLPFQLNLKAAQLLQYAERTSTSG